MLTSKRIGDVVNGNENGFFHGDALDRRAGRGHYYLSVFKQNDRFSMVNEKKKTKHDFLINFIVCIVRVF